MKRIFFFYSILFSALLFTSCQKEAGSDSSVIDDNDDNNNTANDIKGNWKFVSIESSMKNTVQYNEMGVSYKSITTTDYETVENQGEMKIDGRNFSITNMAYKVSTTSQAQSFMNGSLVDTYDFPFEYSMPAYNSTATYKKVGLDSLYFDSGSTFSFQSGSSTSASPSGIKYTLEGKKLTFYSTYNEVKNETMQGISMQVQDDVTISINFEKK